MNYEDAVKDLTRIMEDFFSRQGDGFKKVIDQIVMALRTGHKILIFGNGGSASQAQHFAAELVNKFLKIRPPFRAISLTTDTSALTSIGNDISFDNIFSRQIEALADKGDVALALSTSGNSPNVIMALKAAREKSMLTIALTGKGGGKLATLPDYLFDVPSDSTPRIQEVHLLILHLLAQEIEEKLS